MISRIKRVEPVTWLVGLAAVSSASWATMFWQDGKSVQAALMLLAALANMFFAVIGSVQGSKQ